MLEAAFVLAAGRGERLRPLTDKTPKPLLPLGGRPILDHILDRLKPMNLKRVVLNAWHLKEQILTYAQTRRPKYPFDILVSTEDELLGTGGGLKKALPLIGDTPFLMLNGDCLFEADLRRMRPVSTADALWMVVPEKKDQTVLEAKGRELVKLGKFWQSETPSDGKFCFSGIQLVQKMDANLLPDQGCIIRQYWVPRLEKGAKIIVEPALLQHWEDIGTPERYGALSKQIF